MVVTLRARDTGSKEEEEAVITEKIFAPTTPVLLGSEVTIPIYVDENVSRTEQSQQHDNYLKELLEVYRDQIVTLKLELNHKNEIISDLIQCIKVNKNASVASSNEASIGEATNSPCVAKLDKSVVKTDQDQIDSNHSDNSAWQSPKKAAKASKNKIVQPTVTSNRYKKLADNKWLSDGRKHPNASVKGNSEKKRSIAIVGDSMLKDVKQWNLRKAVPNSNLFLKCFPGAKSSDMVDYVKPSMRNNPDLILCHFGTNDLRSEQSPVQIADAIIDVASKLKSDTNEVVVSSIINRGDGYNEKARSVNSYIVKLCQERNLAFLDNNNIGLNHLQRGGHWGGLHLNSSGTGIFKNNIVNIINC